MCNGANGSLYSFRSNKTKAFPFSMFLDDVLSSKLRLSYRENIPPGY